MNIWPVPATHVALSFNNGGRAEPTKKAKRYIFFVAHGHHGIDRIYSNGGRAEPTKKAKRYIFFVAHGHHGIDRIYSNGGRAEI
ncbi:MAG: hypothetical protein OSA21_06895 [Candidatus Poseidoniaceae archaeon]|nr:hypothetical protein [Candidatus Poseidoniaceae archaeon]